MIFAGSLADQHVLRPPGPVLHAGAGGAAAQQRHDLHEPAHHGPASRQQEDGQEENHGNTEPQANVRRGTYILNTIKEQPTSG